MTEELGHRSTDDVPIDISPEYEQAITKALSYLSRKQGRDGSWTGRYGKNVGECSLVLMAFMSLGNLPGEGEYGHIVANGVQWVMEQAQPSGLIKGEDQAPAMYGHALATLMLSEVWGQTRRDDIGAVLSKAVSLIVQVQGPRGGWGYKSIPSDGDTSVCVMQLMALKSAHEAGVYIPSMIIEKALSLIKTRYNEKEHWYGYNNSAFNYQHMGSFAAGTCIMQICNEKDLLFVTAPLERLIAVMKSKKLEGHKFYFMYYGSVATYYAGAEYYKQWLSFQKDYIINEQKSDGGFGNPHDTAFAILSMALPYRYLPIYQR